MLFKRLKDEEGPSKDTLEDLFEGVLKPLHSRNARRIYEVFYQNKKYNYITTHDIETKLVKEGLSINKKEINGWLVSLQEAGLISKMNERGKPIASNYEDRYTFDLWKLTETGLIVGSRLPSLMAKKDSSLPLLADLTPTTISEIEDLYLTAKLLIVLYQRGGHLGYKEVRKELAIDREKLALYSWPDAAHSDKPLFEIIIKPPSFRSKAFKLFGWFLEQDLSFQLTDVGKRIAEAIMSKEPMVDS
jgi:hypothetical protein